MKPGVRRWGHLTTVRCHYTLYRQIVIKFHIHIWAFILVLFTLEPILLRFLVMFILKAVTSSLYIIVFRATLSICLRSRTSCFCCLQYRENYVFPTEGIRNATKYTVFSTNHIQSRSVLGYHKPLPSNTA